jgi:hypothetical protein
MRPRRSEASNSPQEQRGVASARPQEDDWRGLLGRKVSIRYRLHGDAQHPFSEAIGVVHAVTRIDAAPSVSLLTRRGDRVTVAISDVLAAKVFP